MTRTGVPFVKGYTRDVLQGPSPMRLSKTVGVASGRPAEPPIAHYQRFEDNGSSNGSGSSSEDEVVDYDQKAGGE